MTIEICPVCDDGTLTEHIESTTLKPSGFSKTIVIDHKFSVCSRCESEVVNRKQSIYNRAQVLAQMGDD